MSIGTQGSADAGLGETMDYPLVLSNAAKVLWRDPDRVPDPNILNLDLRTDLVEGGARDPEQRGGLADGQQPGGRRSNPVSPTKMYVAGFASGFPKRSGPSF